MVFILLMEMKIIQNMESEECFGHFRKGHWHSHQTVGEGGVILVKFKSIENQKGREKTST